MLVLSRRLGDKLVFPDLNTTVEVLQMTGKTVRLGIKAPADVLVLRHELGEARSRGRGAGAALQQLSAAMRHRLRNQLHTAKLALTLADKQLEAELTVQARATLAKALDEFNHIEAELAPPLPPPVAKEPAPEVHALLVEDDANESELLAGILRMSGIHCDTAGDGCQALDYLHHHTRPDVVLLDMRMPRCDGPATISAIRHDPLLRGLKVFAVSGTSQADAGLSTGPEGVDRWFSKPIDPSRLVSAMRQELLAAHAAM